ncbi:MAG: ATP-binding protein [Planctomycetota bacterium]
MRLALKTNVAPDLLASRTADSDRVPRSADPGINMPEAELVKALNEVFVKDGGKITLLLAVFYLLGAFSKWIEFSFWTALPLSLLSLAISGALYWTHRALKSSTIQFELAHPVACVLALMMASNSVLQICMTRDARPIFGVVLVIVAASCIFLSQTALLVVSIPSSLAWLLLPIVPDPPREWPETLVSCVFIFGLTIIVQHFRIGKERRIEILRWQDRQLNERLRTTIHTLKNEVEEKERIEQTLRESEQRYRSVSQFTTSWAFDMVVEPNGQMRLLWITGDPVWIAGYDINELQNITDWKNLIHPSDLPSFTERMSRVLAGQDVTTEFRVRNSQGETRWVRVFARPKWNDTRDRVTHVHGAAQDITDLKLADEQMRQLQSNLNHVARLSTLGEMVAGIAHEINQPLYAIANYSTACNNLLPPKTPSDVDKLQRWSVQILEQSQRAGEIIRRLRLFARKAEAEQVPLDMAEVIRESLELASTEIRRYQVQLRLDLPSRLPMVMADRVLIQQVLVNLIRNAAEALAEMPAEDRAVKVEVYVEGSRILVRVSDTGPGLATDAGRDIFEPFVSTKPEGMGMGLAISRSIIEAHGGEIWAASNRPGGTGTSFYFTLPTIKNSKNHESQ